MVRKVELYMHTHRHVHILITGTNSPSPRLRGMHTQYNNVTSRLCLVRFQRFSTKKRTFFFRNSAQSRPTSAGKYVASTFDRIVTNGDGAWVRNEGVTTGLKALFHNAVRQNEGNHEIANNLAGTQIGHVPYSSWTIKSYSQNVWFTFWPVRIFWLMLCEIKDL